MEAADMLVGCQLAAALVAEKLPLVEVLKHRDRISYVYDVHS
jgi:hypothetical protein